MTTTEVRDTYGDLFPGRLSEEDRERIRKEERESIRRDVSLTKVLMQNGVLEMDGTVHRPTRVAMLELLKWHAGGGAMVAVPMSKLATELSCTPYTVRQLLEELESDGLIRRFRRCAPGNLYTIEIVGPVPEPDESPLQALEETLLETLVRRRDEQGIVQTNEHELALELDVSHETVLLSLIGLRRRGYVSSTFALYGRPLIIKVQHERPARDGHSVRASAYCVKCRKKQPMHGARLEQRNGAKGPRVMAVGACAACDTRMASWAPSSLLGAGNGDGERNGSRQKLERFLEWREEIRKQEEEQLRVLKQELGVEAGDV